MTHTLPSNFLKRGEKLVDFCQRNDWQIGISNGGHIRLQHEQAGIYFTAATSSDYRAYLNCLKELIRKMRAKSLPIK
jgi:hypothetical protein